jgi:hypothetical protein
MEEYEDPTESLHEKLNEEAKEKKVEKRWSLWVAISTALIAVIAAITSLFASHYSNEALIEQIKASDLWAYYQSKSIKAEILSHAANPDTVHAARLINEEQKIQIEAKDRETTSAADLEKHVVLAKAVTLFQIAIAISAISIVASKRFLWFIALATAIAGLVFFLQGMVF